MPPLHLKYLPIIETAIALLVVWLPLSNSTVFINGIQTAKSFNFFYGMFALVAVSAIGFLFTKGKLKFNITLIDVLLLVFVVWLTVNKYLLHGVHALSLRYFELLGLMALYIIVRTLKTKYALYLLLALCVSGAVQAIYGNLQLWGRYPSHHGLFKLTGSFFNPGPYAGYLCAVLPIAVGLYWMHENCKFQVSSFKLRLNLFNRQLGTWNLKPEILFQPVIIKYLSLITVVAVLLVLPAARSRAAWLGAIAGVAYLAWHQCNIANWFKQSQPINTKHRTFLNLNLNLNSRLRKWVTVSFLMIFVIGVVIGLYHFKKDSADGRMLIWTVTANIIKDNPLLGVGQGMFTAHYMDYQADYFRNNPGSKYETVADDNQYAFNEALLTWSENGLIGLLLLGGLVLTVFNFKFQVSSFRLQVSSSRLTSEQNDSKFQVPSSKLSSEQPITCNLNRSEAEIGEAKPETITRAAILSILVFGLFAYPSEILPIKMIGILCLGILSNVQIAKKLTCTEVQPATCNLQPETDNLNRSGASNGAAQPESERSGDRRSQTCNLKPVTWNLNRNEVEIGVAKLGIILSILLLTLITYPKISTLKSAYTTWKDAMDLYNYGLYEQCLTDYEKAYPILRNNGEFLINYGKALSIAEKHAEAVTVLEQAKSHQSNSVLYTALGDSHKALEEYESAEQCYSQVANMAPGKFYPLYLLAKLYEASGQQHKALEMANTLLNKKVKVHSTAIEEMKEEMKTIITK